MIYIIYIYFSFFPGSRNKNHAKSSPRLAVTTSTWHVIGSRMQGGPEIDMAILMGRRENDEETHGKYGKMMIDH